MLIGIDASFANRPLKTGIEWYGYHVIRELAKIDRENTYRIYCRDPLLDELSELPDNFVEVIIPHRRFWVHTALARELGRNPVDVFYTPSHIVPWRHPRRTVMTIHDIGFRHFRQNFTIYDFVHSTLNSRLSVKWASQTIVPTQFVANDVIDYYRVPAERVHVIANGYDPRPIEDAGRDGIAAAMARYRIRGPYLLYVGRLEARKNISRIIKAFYSLADRGEFGGQLVLLGRPGVGYDQIRSEIGQKRSPDQIIQPGYVSDEDRAALLLGAKAFVFPSIYEGFGIPILEAFAAGTPVLTSSHGACAEVAGDAALLVDPLDVRAIEQGIKELITDTPLAEKLVQRGRTRVGAFSWPKTASAVHQVLVPN